MQSFSCENEWLIEDDGNMRSMKTCQPSDIECIIKPFLSQGFAIYDFHPLISYQVEKMSNQVT